MGLTDVVGRGRLKSWKKIVRTDEDTLEARYQWQLNHSLYQRPGFLMKDQQCSPAGVASNFTLFGKHSSTKRKTFDDTMIYDRRVRQKLQ